MRYAYVNLDDHFTTTLSKDVLGLVIGNRICTGTTREIYEHASDKSLVVKLENGYQSFCNIYEHQIWDHVKDTEFAKWFAPVEKISGNGIVLLMRKTIPPRPEELPDKVPSFFTDIKIENFGILDGRLVCHDYGYHRFIERGMTKILRKANWKSRESE